MAVDIGLFLPIIHTLRYSNGNWCETRKLRYFSKFFHVENVLYRKNDNENVISFFLLLLVPKTSEVKEGRR